MNALKNLSSIITTLSDAPDLEELVFVPQQICEIGKKTFFISACKANFQKARCVGLGVSTNRDKAAFISVLELIERIAMINHANKTSPNTPVSNFSNNEVSPLHTIGSKFKDFNVFDINSSNGFAIHTDIEDAKQNSLSELIERHTILKAFAHNIYPKVSSKYITLDTLPFKSDFYCWRAPFNRVVGVLKGSLDHRSFYSFGTGSNERMALDDCYREFAMKFNIASTNLPNDLKFSHGSSHSKYHWEKNTPDTDSFFDSAKNQNELPALDPHLKPSEFYYYVVPLPDFLSSTDLVVVRSFSPMIQNLFINEWHPEKVNPLAITQVPKTRELHIIG